MNVFELRERLIKDHRTKGAILEIYDLMEKWRIPGRDYVTRLDPPPGAQLTTQPAQTTRTVFGETR